MSVKVELLILSTWLVRLYVEDPDWEEIVHPLDAHTEGLVEVPAPPPDTLVSHVNVLEDVVDKHVIIIFPLFLDALQEFVVSLVGPVVADPEV